MEKVPFHPSISAFGRGKLELKFQVKSSFRDDFLTGTDGFLAFREHAQTSRNERFVNVRVRKRSRTLKRSQTSL